jgi:PAS domain S-box-containing protein
VPVTDVALFRLLVDRVFDYAIFLLTPEGRVASWNAGAERLKQYSAHEIIGQSFAAFYRPEDRAAGRPAKLLAEARAQGSVEDLGWRVRKDGSLFWADVVVTALTDDNGELVGFAKVTRDLTARRQAEYERAQRQAAERAADRLQRLQVASVVLAAATSVREAARLLAETTSASLQAACGAVALSAPDGQVVDIVTAGALPRQLTDGLNRALASNSTVNDEQLAAVPLVVDDRKLGALGVYFEQQHVLDADVGGFLCALAEFGAQAMDRARLYESERAARAEAEAAVRVQDEFLSIAAHELRTPVSAVKATAQLANRSIERGSLDPARVTRHLNSISRAADRLGALIDDLLDVSRLQTGSLKIHRRRLDLRLLVEEVVDRYVATAPSHEFHLELPERSAEVDADPLRLEQVLDNVLSNAVKYSPEGGVIDVSLQTEGDRVTLTVTDHGIGLPTGQEERIFDAFGRGSNARHHQIQGLGLGLAICRQLIDLHGGRIWAANAGNGSGTCVGFHLPLASAAGAREASMARA